MRERYFTQERIKEITDKARQQAIEDINWITQEGQVSIKKNLDKEGKMDVIMDNGTCQTKRHMERKHTHLGTDNPKTMP